MDFSFTEEQETVAKVARQLFEHRATPEHLTELEAGEVRYDAALWRELATSDLLGIALPENVGGSGGGFLELACFSPRSAGASRPYRSTRPWYSARIPLRDTVTRHSAAVSPRSRRMAHHPDRRAHRTRALRPDGTRTTARADGDGWRLDGTKELVPRPSWPTRC